MATVVCAKLNSPPSNGFTCGNRSINNSIKNSYELSLVQRCHAYSIKTGDTLLGYYMVALKCFPLSVLKHPLDDYCFGNFNDLYALHLEFIAVGEQFQHHQIGTYVLQKIIHDAYSLSLVCPLRLLTMYALTSKIPWYKNLGFKEIDGKCGDNPETKLLYMDLLPPENSNILTELAEQYM